MTPAQREDIKACIKFFESKGWDWGDPVEFLARKYNGTLDTVIVRTRIGGKGGRKKKDSSAANAAAVGA